MSGGPVGGVAGMFGASGFPVGVLLFIFLFLDKVRVIELFFNYFAVGLTDIF